MVARRRFERRRGPARILTHRPPPAELPSGAPPVAGIGPGYDRRMTNMLVPQVLPPGGGETIEGPAGGPLAFKVRGEETGGSLTA